MIKNIKCENLVYIDESGIDECLIKEYVYAPRGKKILGFRSGKKFARENFISALCNKTILAPMCFSGSCDKMLMLYWITHFLIPALRKGQYVIMDNISFHKSQEIRDLIEAAGCFLIFLPAYSPDFNPIENFWAWLKQKIRETSHSFCSLQDAVDHVFNMSQNYVK